MYCDTVEFYRSIYGVTYQIPLFEDWIAQHQLQQQQEQQKQQQLQQLQQQQHTEKTAGTTAAATLFLTSCTTEKETVSASNPPRMFWTNEQTKSLVHAWKKNVKVIENHQ